MQKGIHYTWILICIFSAASGFIAGRWSTDSVPELLPDFTSDKESAQNEKPVLKTDNTKISTKTNAKTDNFQKSEQEISATSSQREPAESATTLVADQPIIPYPDPATTAQPETDDKALKAEVAASLKENGLSDEEIEQSLQGLFPEPAPEPNVPENTENLSPEQILQDVKSSLRESGIPEEHIDEFAKGFVSAIEAQE